MTRIRILVICAALASMLAGCANMGAQKTYGRDFARTSGFTEFVAEPNPTAPNVFVVGSQVVIDQEPIRPPGTGAGDPITIYFALKEGGDWVFRDHGIEIQGHPGFCDPTSPFVVRCQYSRPVPGTVYKYNVRVWSKATPHVSVKDLDPTIMN